MAGDEQPPHLSVVDRPLGELGDRRIQCINPGIARNMDPPGNAFAGEIER